MVNIAMQAPPINMHGIKLKKKSKGAERGRERENRNVFLLFCSVTGNNNQSCLISIIWFVLVDKSVLNSPPCQTDTEVWVQFGMVVKQRLLSHMGSCLACPGNSYINVIVQHFENSLSKQR